MVKISAFAAALMCCVQGVYALDAPRSPVAASFSQAALVGMQLSVVKMQQEQPAKFSPAVIACVQKLKPNSFEVVVASLLSQGLTAEELNAAEDFYASPVGQKYAKLGLMQIYSSVGATPPESTPVMLQGEYRELENFSHTSAGDKLMVKKIFESPTARDVIRNRIADLLKKCGHKG